MFADPPATCFRNWSDPPGTRRFTGRLPRFDAPLPRAVLHSCAAHCFTWYLTHDRKGYSPVPGYPGIADNSPGVVIASFTRESVVLNRTDPQINGFRKA